MLQKDDLKEVIVEVLETMVGKNFLADQKPKDDAEFLTRDELCARLHITYTTLWRMEKRGEIHVHKIEVDALISQGSSSNTKMKEV